MTALVLKIGGSLEKNGQLCPVLDLTAHAGRRVVVVPGGGTYADLIRDEQARLGYSDAEAHRRALFAMHQMAHNLIDMQPKLTAAETLPAIRECWLRRKIPVWLPVRMVLKDKTLPADWSVTSDALAARLAERLGRIPLVLVKSVRVPRSAGAEALARKGIVDPVFASIVARSGLDWQIVGPGQRGELKRLLE